MTSQPRQQKIAIHIYILRNKEKQTMKFGLLIEYKMRDIFLEKPYPKYSGETIPRPFSKKSKLRFPGRYNFKTWYLTKLQSWFIPKMPLISHTPSKLRKIFPKVWLFYFLLNRCTVQASFDNFNFSFSHYP